MISPLFVFHPSCCCSQVNTWYISGTIFLLHDCLTAHQCNKPRSIDQYSNMAPRLSGQTSIFGVVFFVSKSLLGIEKQKTLNLQVRPESRTWPIVRILTLINTGNYGLFFLFTFCGDIFVSSVLHCACLLRIISRVICARIKKCRLFLYGWTSP